MVVSFWRKHTLIVYKLITATFQVYDLFLSFCQVNDLRKPLCSTLLQIRPTETRLTTPCNSICRTATLTIEHAIFPEVPFYGIKLIAFILQVSQFLFILYLTSRWFQEALEEGMKINEIVNPGFITSLIHNIKAEPDLSSKHALYCFKIILETFQLVESIYYLCPFDSNWAFCSRSSCYRWRCSCWSYRDF